MQKLKFISLLVIGMKLAFNWLQIDGTSKPVDSANSAAFQFEFKTHFIYELSANKKALRKHL